MTFRVGILGCANIARRSLAPAFAGHAGFKLVAIGSRDQDKANDFASQYGARPCSYDELLAAPDIDLVYCPLPTGLHYEYVLKCLRHGKHVLCEKSLATRLSEVEHLIDVAKSNRLFLMESFQFRFHKQNVFARDLVRSGALGKIRQVVIRFGFPPFPDGHDNIRYSKNLGGGALLDAGAYTLKAASYLFGENLFVDNARTWSEPGEEVDVGGSVDLHSDAGVPLCLAYGFNNHYQCGYDVWGEKGLVRTTRAFTAPPGFAAKVEYAGVSGPTEHVFADDHFHALLDYVHGSIATRTFDREYAECLCQARLIDAVWKIGGF